MNSSLVSLPTTSLSLTELKVGCWISEIILRCADTQAFDWAAKAKTQKLDVFA